MLKAGIMVACSICLTTGSQADRVLLSGQEISRLFSGASIEIDTPLGSKMPVRYGQDGELFGRARQLTLYLGAMADTGRWWVSSDRLCHKWNRWLASEPQCFRLQKEGQLLRWWSQDGKSGTALITQPAIEAVSLTQASAEGRGPSPETTSTPAVALFAQAALMSTHGMTGTWQSSTAAAVPAAQQPAPMPTPSAAYPQAKAAAEPKGAVEPSYVVANVERGDVLNVRSGPSTEFDVVAALPPGSRGVSITGACRSGWCPVQHRGASGWVNRTYLVLDAPVLAHAQPDAGHGAVTDEDPQRDLASTRDATDAPRSCLTSPARALLERIEAEFGPVKLVSTCRPGAMIAGTGRPSRHASGNAVDFDAGARKGAIVEWLIANHHAGGTMTYADMSHIHVDIGPYFVSIAGGVHWASWRK
jgi:Bacterial SH3 domain/Peptidase M15